jgi:hypothetical protein
MIEIGRVIIGSPFIVSDLSKLVAYGAGALRLRTDREEPRADRRCGVGSLCPKRSHQVPLA